MIRKLHKVTIHCDGSCHNSGSPPLMGIGIVAEAGKHRKEWSLKLGEGTNILAELQAIRHALLALKQPSACDVTIFTDSLWSINAITGQQSNKKHRDLIDEIRSLMGECGRFELSHCYGHKDNEGNIRADKLAGEARKCTLKETESARQSAHQGNSRE